ncbi:hypothetical protein DPMN_175359 [Dreissena polymorpha]|uniref:Uncharacterized protein n=1 Tax=Dreissena polymorpha TaxID=45954 RepID=A0A9D4IJI5_DREPO|nr:hypothetical protein DPMN_175359 [Dreissena polymorpha]
MASTLPLYGFEPHETGNNSGIVRLWVGPSGLKIENECRECNQNFVQRQEQISPCYCMSRLGDFFRYICCIPYLRTVQEACIPYSAIVSLDLSKSTLQIAINQGSRRSLCLKVRIRPQLAKSAYRSLVEMRTFYHENRVPVNIQNMTGQSLLGVLVSMLKRSSKIVR